MVLGSGRHACSVSRSPRPRHARCWRPIPAAPAGLLAFEGLGLATLIGGGRWGGRRVAGCSAGGMGGKAFGWRWMMASLPGPAGGRRQAGRLAGAREPLSMGHSWPSALALVAGEVVALRQAQILSRPPGAALMDLARGLLG